MKRQSQATQTRRKRNVKIAKYHLLLGMNRKTTNLELRIYKTLSLMNSRIRTRLVSHYITQD